MNSKTVVTQRILAFLFRLFIVQLEKHFETVEKCNLETRTLFKIYTPFYYLDYSLIFHISSLKRIRINTSIFAVNPLNAILNLPVCSERQHNRYFADDNVWNTLCILLFESCLCLFLGGNCKTAWLLLERSYDQPSCIQCHLVVQTWPSSGIPFWSYQVNNLK